MSGVFGKNPNMKKNPPAEVERQNVERKRGDCLFVDEDLGQEKG